MSESVSDHLKPKEEQPQLNTIFQDLVPDRDGLQEDQGYLWLVGLLAYGIYKDEKRRLIKAYNDKYGKHPNNNDLEHIMLTFDKKRLVEYSDSAESLLYTYADALMDEKKNDIIQKTMESSLLGNFNNLRQEAVNEVKKITDAVIADIKKETGVIPSFKSSFYASIAYSLLVAVFLFIITVSYPDMRMIKLAKALITGQDFNIVYIESANPDQPSQKDKPSQ